MESASGKRTSKNLNDSNDNNIECKIVFNLWDLRGKR